MASESSNSPSSDTPQSIFDRLINSRNRESWLLLPLILGFTSAVTDPGQTRPERSDSEPDPDDDSGNRSSPDESTRQQRIVVINPVTQTMTVIEGAGLDMDALYRGAVVGKGGQPPAAKSAVEALPRVEITDDDGEKGECVICLEEYKVGSYVKKMPCEHAFHEKCIEKWLSIHGNCPVCRFSMPVDEEDEKKKGEDSESESESESRGGRVSREVWVSFSFGDLRRRSRGGGGSSGEDGGDQSRGGDQMMDID